jgi:hypothetical protein
MKVDFFDMIYNMIYDMVLYGMVWCMVLYGIWYGMVRCNDMI